MSAADVKMEIPVLVRSLKSSILSSTSFQTGKTFWGVVSGAKEQSRHKANMVAQGDGKFGPWGWLQDPSKPKKKIKKNCGFIVPLSFLHALFQCWLSFYSQLSDDIAAMVGKDRADKMGEIAMTALGYSESEKCICCPCMPASQILFFIMSL